MRSVRTDFAFGKQLGTGTYGTVWLAARKVDGKTYAVKELDLRLLDRLVSLLAPDRSQTCLVRLTMAILSSLAIVRTCCWCDPGASRVHSGGQSSGQPELTFRNQVPRLFFGRGVCAPDLIGGCLLAHCCF